MAEQGKSKSAILRDNKRSLGTTLAPNDPKSEELEGVQRVGRTAVLHGVNPNKKHGGEDFNLKTHDAFINSSARANINRFLKSNPKIRELQQQEKILIQKIREYKDAGANEHVETCKKQLEYIRHYLDSNRNLIQGVTSKSQAERAELINKVKTNKTIKNASKRIKALEEEIKFYQPRTLKTMFADIRRRLKKTHGDDFEDLIADDLDSNVVYDLNDVLDNIEDERLKDKTLSDLYTECVRRIAEITGLSTSEIRNSSNRDVNKWIEAAFQNDETLAENYKQIEEQIEAAKAIKSLEMSQIYGTDNVEAMLIANREKYDIDGEAKQAKELLASMYIGRVNAIVNNLCNRLGNYDNMYEMRSIGYLHLAKAIDEWSKVQRATEAPVPFDSFFKSSVRLGIIRDSQDIMGSGVISGSSIADKKSRYKSALNQMVLELKHTMGEDTPLEVLEQICADRLESGYETTDSKGNRVMKDVGKYRVPTVNTETEYSKIIGGEDGDDGDIWSNVVSSKDNPDEMSEDGAREHYAKLIESFKELFGLFEFTVSSTTGEVSYHKVKKLFDWVDKELFLMHYGIVNKKDEDGNTVPYNQKEMGQEIAKIHKKYLGVEKTMSQPAVGDRIKKIHEKLKLVMKTHPKIATAFNYIMETWMENRVVMEKVSVEFENKLRDNHDELFKRR